MSAADILAKIAAENVELRKNNNTIQECIRDVKVPEQLFPMHPNTNLIITDVPGVNEAGSSEMYLNYVEQVWDELDCVVIVMDADQGVNTEEQVKLLEFVKGNLNKYKMMPTFILCNKVDDPHDEEIMALVEEVRGKVNQIFKRMKLKPTLIHVSAENAFAYRAASRLTRQNMRHLNRECLDKIGYEEVGKVKWRRMSMKKKCDLVYEVVTDKTQYDERLALSNFDKFLEALSCTLGGSENQATLIEGQLQVQLKKLKVCLEDEALFGDTLVKAFEYSCSLGKPTHHLHKKFWTLYSYCEEEAFQKFEQCPTNVRYLQKPMKELQNYAKGLHLKLFTSLLSSDDMEKKDADEAKLMNAMKGLMSRQIKIVSGNEIKSKMPARNPALDPWTWDNYNYGCWIMNGSNHQNLNTKSKRPESGMYCSHWEWKEENCKWYNKYDTSDVRDGSKDINPALITTSWENAQPKDWCTMIYSLLLLKYNKHFCEDFSAEIVELEIRNRLTTRFSNSNTKEVMIGMEVPTSLSDPNHFGSLGYTYCEFKDTFSK
jgi:hypothetical protein